MNADVARLFNEAADLLEIRGENAFRIRAYRTAARTVESLPHSIVDLAREGPARLAKLRGIGMDLAGKIEEIVATGSFALLDELRTTVSPGVLELMRFPGLGPKRAKRLYDDLGIDSVAALLRAAQQEQLRGLKGFGPKTEANIIATAQAGAAQVPRMPRPFAAQYVEQLVSYLPELKGVDRVEVAGSYRRLKDTVGDIDILVTCADRMSIGDALAHYPGVDSVLAKGKTRASVRLHGGLQVDVRALAPASFGAGLYYFTGSKAHNVAVRRIAQQHGLKINEYGVYRGPRRLAGKTEEDVLRAVGLPWIPPELREDTGEIEAARAGTLPNLVTLDDIRGDLQMHTTSSDGRDTLDAMAHAAEDLGYEYIAVTDHSPSVRIAGGLNRAGFRKQMREIDALNRKLRRLSVLKGAEVDILADGSLDLDDQTLRALDIVVVSIHSHLGLNPEAQTARLVRAMQHPSVDILAHPTGRLLGKRPGINADLGAVFRAAADNGVIMEINAQPERLDLDEVSARQALDAGIQLGVSTDAHSVDELRFMRWGVDQARRAWARAPDLVNTRPLPELLARLHGSR